VSPLASTDLPRLRPPAGRPGLCLGPTLIGLAVVVSVALAGCSVEGGSGSASPESIQPVPTPRATESAAPSIDATGALAASDDRLSMTVWFEPTVLEPGGNLTVHTVVGNVSSAPVVLADPCGAPRVVGMVPVPVEPLGRKWDGIAGEFKAYAMKEGLGPIDHPEATSTRVDVLATCDAPGSDTLEPGASTSASFTWKADLVRGAPAPAGEIPITITVARKPAGGSPSTAPDQAGSGTGLLFYEELTVDGVVRVVGESAPMLSAGEAVDAILADGRFAKWLSRQPRGTWSAVHVFLVDYPDANDVVPAGPSWDIELFREIGVPRNWAIGFVDPFTAKVSKLTFCNDPCDR